MKVYTNPALEIVEIAVEDVITTSGNPLCPNETDDRDN